MDSPTPSFDDWYVEIHPKLVTIVAATLGDVDLACDAADEALTRALARWDTVGEMQSPNGWVYRVALNVCKRRLRRRSLERRLLRRLPAPEPIDGPTGELWAMVKDLGPRQQQAVLLRHVADFTEPEIGEVMGVSRGTVNATLRAAYVRLRALVVEESSSASSEEARHA